MGKNGFTEYEWEDVMNNDSALRDIFVTLISVGFNPSTIRNCGRIIGSAVALAPNLAGVELDELITQTVEEYKAKMEEYKVKTEEYRKECQIAMGDIPMRENQLRQEEDLLRNKKHDLAIALYDLEQREKTISERERSLEDFEKKLNEYETPIARDQVRKARAYMEAVPQSQWTDKAIAWSLGAIFSGTQIPNFGGEK